MPGARFVRTQSQQALHGDHLVVHNAVGRHQVTLWERKKDLGGTARIAALPYEPNGRLVSWLIGAVRAEKVDIRLGRSVSTEQLLADNPDHVVVAAGASRGAPDIPGAPSEDAAWLNGTDIVVDGGGGTPSYFDIIDVDFRSRNHGDFSFSQAMHYASPSHHAQLGT